MKKDRLTLLFDDHVIQRRVVDLAHQINDCYNGEALVVICVLKGACIFFSDLVRKLQGEPMLDFVALSSYGNKTRPGECVTLTMDVSTALENKHVLVVEDIVDTGRSIRWLLDHLWTRQPRSLRLAALLDKYERREVSVPVDFHGFRVTEGFIVGYGLDYAEKYRELPALYTLQSE